MTLLKTLQEHQQKRFITMHKLLNIVFTTSIFITLTACGGGSGGSTFDSDTNSGGSTNSGNDTNTGSNGSTSGGSVNSNASQTYNIRLKKLITNTGNAIITSTYEYDNNNRLKKSTDVVSNTPNDQSSAEYKYDSANNLIKVIQSNHYVIEYEYTNNQLMKRTSYYDTGAILSLTKATEWDDSGLPTLIESTNFGIDGSIRTSSVTYNTFTNKELAHSREVLTAYLSNGTSDVTTTLVDITYEMDHTFNFYQHLGNFNHDFRPLSAAPHTHHIKKRQLTTTNSDGTHTSGLNTSYVFNNLDNPETEEIVFHSNNIVTNVYNLEYEYENAN